MTRCGLFPHYLLTNEADKSSGVEFGSCSFEMFICIRRRCCKCKWRRSLLRLKKQNKPVRETKQQQSFLYILQKKECTSELSNTQILRKTTKVDDHRSLSVVRKNPSQCWARSWKVSRRKVYCQCQCLTLTQSWETAMNVNKEGFPRGANH